MDGRPSDQVCPQERGRVFFLGGGGVDSSPGIGGGKVVVVVVVVVVDAGGGELRVWGWVFEGVGVGLEEGGWLGKGGVVQLGG